MKGVARWPCSLAVTVIAEANQKVKHDEVKYVGFFFFFEGRWPSSSSFSSVQFSHLVMSLWDPHGLLQARPPCPSPTPRVYPNSCPLSQWCHPTISSSDSPFTSCPQSFPPLGYFQMNQPFTSGCQSIGVSASTSVFPMNTQDWSPLVQARIPNI